MQIPEKITQLQNFVSFKNSEEKRQFKKEQRNGHILGIVALMVISIATYFLYKNWDEDFHPLLGIGYVFLVVITGRLILFEWLIETVYGRLFNKRRAIGNWHWTVTHNGSHEILSQLQSYNFWKFNALNWPEIYMTVSEIGLLFFDFKHDKVGYLDLSEIHGVTIETRRSGASTQGESTFQSFTLGGQAGNFILAGNMGISNYSSQTQYNYLQVMDVYCPNAPEPYYRFISGNEEVIKGAFAKLNGLIRQMNG